MTPLSTGSAAEQARYHPHAAGLAHREGETASERGSIFLPYAFDRPRCPTTVRKSQARIPAACWRRNWPHVGPRLGAGPRPARRSTVAIVVAETLTPSLSISPRIRM